MRISIDFDGTIVHDEYPNVGELVHGAKKYIQRLFDDGHSIIINTCRAQEHEWVAKRYLILEGIPFDYMNCNLPDDIKHFGMDCRKISADVYIDDKQVGGLPSWKKIYKFIKEKNERDFNCQ